jgi:hypothetical protein
LQPRSASSARRLESELRLRLENLTHSQLELLAKGTGDDRNAMAWLAVLKRIQIAFALLREVLANKLTGLDLVLRCSDRASFCEASEREHPELAGLPPSPLFLIENPLHAASDVARRIPARRQSGKGGALCTVQATFPLSPGPASGSASQSRASRGLSDLQAKAADRQAFPCQESCQTICKYAEFLRNFATLQNVIKRA